MLSAMLTSDEMAEIFRVAKYTISHARKPQPFLGGGGLSEAWQKVPSDVPTGFPSRRCIEMQFFFSSLAEMLDF